MNRFSALLRLSPIALTAIAVSPANVHAELLFSADGNDLLISISEPIDFTITQATSASQYHGFHFQDVFSSPTNFNAGPADPLSTSRMIVAGGTEGEPFSGGDYVGSGFGGPNDFWIVYFFSSPQEFQPNDVVTLGAGTFRIEDYLDMGTLPDLPATTAVFIDGNRDAVSDPTVVPEPSTYALALSGAFLLLAIFRRRARRVARQ